MEGIKSTVATTIAQILNVDNIESFESPEELVNMALSKLKTMPLTMPMVNTVNKMIKLADDVGIQYDKTLLPDIHIHEDAKNIADHYGRKSSVIDTIKSYKSKTPPIVVDPTKSNNMSALRPEDEIRLKNVVMTGHKDDDTEPGINQPKHTAIGGTLHHDIGNDSMRYRKIKQHLCESDCDDPNCTDTKCVDAKKHDIEALGNNDIPDSVINSAINRLDFHDYLDAYKPSELSIVHKETGKEVVDFSNLKESAFSNSDIIKTKFKFHIMESNDVNSHMIALKTFSDAATLNDRSKIITSKIMNKRPFKLIDHPDHIKSTSNRISMKLVDKIKRIEQKKLSHPEFTK